MRKTDIRYDRAEAPTVVFTSLLAIALIGAYAIYGPIRSCKPSFTQGTVIDKRSEKHEQHQHYYILIQHKDSKRTRWVYSESQAEWEKVKVGDFVDIEKIR